jgi:hypothetical protein
VGVLLLPSTLEGLRDVPTQVLGRGNVPLSEGEELLPLYREDDLRAFSGDLERSLYGRRCHSGVDGYSPVAFLYTDANHGEGTPCRGEMSSA